MEYDNIDRLQQLRQLTRNIEPTTEQIPSTQVSNAVLEFTEQQIYANLKATKKPVSQMTDQEKLIYAKFEQKMIENYEMFCASKYEEREETYSGKGSVFFSPTASIVLDEFFTDGEH